MNVSQPLPAWERGLESSTVRTVLSRNTPCRAHGITLSRLYRTDGIDTVIKLVRSGKGVILGPRSFADYYNVAAVPLDPPEDVYLEFICLGKNAMRPDILMFRRFMEELCKGKTE